jgi:DUF1365 family protein
MSLTSGIYTGEVRHRRFKPRKHAFTYQIYMVMLDLQRLPELASASRLFSLERFNWLSFRDRDYLPHRSESALIDRLEADAKEAGHGWPGGAVFLLTHLRVLGYCFNPVSYYYCCDAAGRVRLICAEVTNTPWKERVTYWMDPEESKGSPEGTAWGFEVQKRMHVSPFNPMGLLYRWAFSEPGDRLLVSMALLNCSDFFFDVNLRLARNFWSAPNLRRILYRFPLITLQVMAAIHWEAFKLWIKRVPIFTHPKKSGIAPH